MLCVEIGIFQLKTISFEDSLVKLILHPSERIFSLFDFLSLLFVVADDVI
jgi:hypothetical protein